MFPTDGSLHTWSRKLFVIMETICHALSWKILVWSLQCLHPTSISSRNRWSTMCRCKLAHMLCWPKPIKIWNLHSSGSNFILHMKIRPVESLWVDEASPTSSDMTRLGNCVVISIERRSTYNKYQTLKLSNLEVRH